MREARAPSFWTVYFDVANCDETAAHARKLGAAVVMAPTDIPDVGRFAVLKDLEGAGFAIMQSNARSG
jgi:predicted enzyme related to lactoylglutathione lyase